jgi:hypothetical protein
MLERDERDSHTLLVDVQARAVKMSLMMDPTQQLEQYIRQEACLEPPKGLSALVRAPNNASVPNSDLDYLTWASSGVTDATFDLPGSAAGSS